MSTDVTADQLENAARELYGEIDARPFDPEGVRRWLSEDYRDHNRPPGFDGLSDREAMVALLTGLAAAFPHGRHQLERVEPVGSEEVLIYWRFTGAHTGEPIFGIPTSGASVNFVGIDLLRMDGGAFAEHRHVEELLSLTGQLQATQ